MEKWQFGKDFEGGEGRTLVNNQHEDLKARVHLQEQRREQGGWNGMN